MKDMTPDAWIASMSEDGTNITIPIASITALTAAEADATTGDIREFLYKLLVTLVGLQDGLPTEDKPDYMIIDDVSSFTSTGKMQTRFSITFTRDIATSTATAEPA